MVKENSGDLREALRALFPDVAKASDEEDARRDALKSRMKQIDKTLTAEKEAEATLREAAKAAQLKALQEARDLRHHWKDPPVPLKHLDYGAPNLSGRAFGSLRVIQYHDTQRWLVRCLCGAFEIRTTKIVLKADALAKCQACRNALVAKQMIERLPTHNSLPETARLFDRLAEQARTKKRQLNQKPLAGDRPELDISTGRDQSKLCASNDVSKQGSRVHSLTPIPPIRERPDFVADLSGKTYGKLQVIRYHGSGKSGSRWQVQCVCGAFEIRTTKAVRRADHTDSCNTCHQQERSIKGG